MNKSGALAVESGVEGGVSKIRTVVVEDEPVSRNRLLSLLQEENDVEVVGACGDGREAATTIAKAKPDLLFVDIQLPELDGMSLVRGLDHDDRPAVVFVTAHDTYALRAFEMHVLDYLLKPFSAQRFRSALAYAREHLAQRRATSLGRQVLELLPAVQRVQAPPSDRLVVKSSGRIYFVRVEDIDWCEAAGNYIRVHAGTQSHLIRETMNRLEARLDSRLFVRIHRSTIVNIDRIQELRSSFGGEHVVHLRGGTRLTMSRGYRDGLQERLRRPV